MKFASRKAYSSVTHCDTGFPAFDRRLELDLARSANGIFRQAVRQPAHYSHPIQRAVRKQQHFQSHHTLHANPPSFARVTRIRFIRDLSLLSTSFGEKPTPLPWSSRCARVPSSVQR